MNKRKERKGISQFLTITRLFSQIFTTRVCHSVYVTHNEGSYIAQNFPVESYRQLLSFSQELGLDFQRTTG